MRLFFRLLALLATAAALPACSEGECNEPLFSTPLVPDGVQATLPSTSEAIVRWDRVEGDVLPDEYYLQIYLSTRAEAGTSGVSKVEVLAPRELRIEFRNLDYYLTSHDDVVVVPLGLGDTRGFAECDHPGRGDSFYVDLTLNFDAAHEITSASFGKLGRSLGACAMRPGGTDAPTSRAWLLVVAGLALGGSVRRARRRPRA